MSVEWEADPRHSEIITETLGLRRAEETDPELARHQEKHGRRQQGDRPERREPTEACVRTLGEGQTRHLVHSQEDGEFDVSTDHGVGDDKALWKIYAGQAENCDAAAGCHDHGESRLPRKTCNPGGVDGTDSHCVVKRRVRVLQVCVAQQQRRIYGNVVKVAPETHSVSGRDMSRRLGAAKVRHVDMGARSLPAVKQRSD